jgi:rod shape-determining protein MreD
MTLRIVLVIGTSLCLAIAGSVVPFLLHLRAARPDFLLVAVLYLAVHDDVIEGAALSAVAGYLADLTSATPPFLYTFLAVLTFVVLRTVGSGLKTDSGLQAALVAFGTAIGHSLVASAVLGFFTGTGVHLQTSTMLWSAFGTALCAPFVFAILRRLDALFVHVDGPAPRGIR